jgi:hypothetical protein
MIVKKQMINSYNPDSKLCYVIIADIDGIEATVEAEIHSGTDDPDAEIERARLECMAKLEAMSKTS